MCQTSYNNLQPWEEKDVIGKYVVQFFKANDRTIFKISCTEGHDSDAEEDDIGSF